MDVQLRQYHVYDSYAYNQELSDLVHEYLLLNVLILHKPYQWHDGVLYR